MVYELTACVQRANENGSVFNNDDYCKVDMNSFNSVHH